MIKVFVVALTTLAFSGVSFAQEKKATPATPATPAMEKKTEMKSEKPKATRVTGEVKSVDAKAGMLTVKTKDKEINLTADAKAKGALEKIKVGNMVKVSYTEKDGKMIASSIAVDKAKKGAKATEKMEEKKGEMEKKTK
jgi:Cu/Ag efflux protein CusF